MAEQGRDDCVQEQDWLSLGIQVMINNSPGTPFVQRQFIVAAVRPIVLYSAFSGSCRY